MYYTRAAYASVAYRRDGKLFQDDIAMSDEFRHDWQLNAWLTRELSATLEWIREDHLPLVAILVVYRTLIHHERGGDEYDYSLHSIAGELRRPGHDPIILDKRALDAVLSCWNTLIG